VRALNGLLERLSTALNIQKAFVADAAHELRTPLAAVQIQAQLVGRAKDEAARNEALADLQAGVTRATRLAEQLLALARAEPDGAAVTDAVDLCSLLHECVAAYAPLALDRGVDLGVEASEAATVTGDADALRVMLNNLIDNATKYTPRGGRVDVSLCVEDEHPVVRIADSGPGIDPAEREREPGTHRRGRQRAGPRDRAPHRDAAPRDRVARRVANGRFAGHRALLTVSFRLAGRFQRLLKMP
jgi:two-component system OmpR family sensor kinase